VTEDGFETDLDLGHYERFTGIHTTRNNSITTGRIYKTVIDRERHGDYLGKTIQVVPHITDEIKRRMLREGLDEGLDFVITEVGGTIGDIESAPFMEAIRQLRWQLGRDAVCVHLTYVPYLKAADELKTMPFSSDSNRDAFEAYIAGNKYLHILKSGKKYIGAPIYFFFKIGTHELTENAQFINIKEVSEVIKKYGLQARIIGAADSETGTPEINERLSVERADYIAGLLKAHGVDETHIQKKHRGGIDSYEPLNGNRNTCVVLYFK